MAASRYRSDLEDRWDCDLARDEHCFSLGEWPKWLRFGCRRDSRISCQIALRPQRNAVGASWSWDGNREAPTISPSINCEKACGWHGWLRNGVFSDA